MIPLAFNLEGEVFELPPTAAGWRVKRLRGGKGAPELVYGPDGVPLVVPLETEVEDLRSAVIAPGKYRLDPVDDQHRVIKTADSGYVLLRATEPEPTRIETVASDGSPNAMTVVIEAMRQNAEMARTIVDRFPAMLEASAALLKAADGAGLPARMPRHDERDDDSDDDDDEAAPVPAGFDLNAVIAQVVPTLVMGFMKGDFKLPNLAEMLDWRRAARKPGQNGESKPKPGQNGEPKPGQKPGQNGEPKPKPSASTAKPEPAAAPASTTEASDTAATDVDAELPPLSPQAIAHFLAIQSALTPEEAWLARAAASELSPSLLRAWFDELSGLSVPEAVARVRTLVTGPRAAEAAA